MPINEIRKLKEEAGKPKEPKKRKPIPRTSKKKKAANTGGGAELNRWFEDRRKEMTGRCANCGKRSCKHDNNYYKFSVAHILPKAYFKSVATHPDNWIELCFWGDKSCHTNLDNGMFSLLTLSNWDDVVIKFQRMYPFIAKEERKRIPDYLLQYINTDQ